MKTLLKKARAWLYFLGFLVVFWLLAVIRQTDFYDRYLWMVDWGVFLSGLAILSIIALWQWWMGLNGTTSRGLPAPRIVRRWFYDEPE
jgi:hypothetical protein